MVPTALLAALLTAPLIAARTASPTTDLAVRLDRLAGDVRMLQRETSRLRDDVILLRMRGADGPGRRADPGLALDVSRLVMDSQLLTRELRWRLLDARSIEASIPEKAPDLAAPAAHLAGEARWLSNETRWFDADVRIAAWDLRRSGYFFEAMDLEQDVRDIKEDAKSLKRQSDLIVAKTR